MKKIKKIVKEIIKNHKLNKKVRKCKRISKKQLIDEKLIIFSAFAGANYADSPKAIYEYIIDQPQYLDFKFIWAFKNEEGKEVKEDARTVIVKYNSKEFFQYLSKAKYWIFNFKTPKYFIKKDNQIFIQCWHGTPLKRLGCDIEIEKGNKATKLKDIHNSYLEDAKKYDYFISPSKFASEKFCTAFALDKLGKKDIIVEKGYPRNDELFKYSKEDINNIKNKLNLPNNKKIILYAPTFRDNQYKAGVGHTYELGINLLRLQEELSDNYIILMRLHYLVSNIIDVSQFKNFVYDVSKYEDVNDLYIISDILVTDYSSVFFDYANLKKPILFYMYDLKSYKENIRDFYIDLKELPGPIIKNDKKLIKYIKKIDDINKIYNNQYNIFNNKYNYLGNGTATKKVVEECIK